MSISTNGRCLKGPSGKAEPEPDKQAQNRLPNGQFAPGASGNPRGRPRGRTLRGEIQGVLDTIDLAGTGTRLTARNVVARMLVRMAMDGDMRAAALILAGEPRRLVEHRSPSVCPADTGRPEDVVNHFLATGQLPADADDLPEFLFEMLAAFLSKDNTEEVTRRLETRVVETFGSLDAFREMLIDQMPASRTMIDADLRRTMDPESRPGAPTAAVRV